MVPYYRRGDVTRATIHANETVAKIGSVICTDNKNVVLTMIKDMELNLVSPH
jgi:hypothetical protein